MTPTIRHAQLADAPALLNLIDALADYENLAPPDPQAKQRLLQHGWPQDGTPPRFQAWLAELDSNPVGYAITFQTYSSFLARPTLYIEDIFILPSHRRARIGSALMNRLIQEAIESDCGRMEWVVLDWNESARQFYQRLGAKRQTEWQPYRLLREDFPNALKIGG